MAEWIGLSLASVAAPANAATRLIQHHSRHRNLPAGSHPLAVAQQALHPLLLRPQRRLSRQGLGGWELAGLQRLSSSGDHSLVAHLRR